MGGFEAAPGLHREFEEWVKKRIPNPIKLKKKVIQQKSRQKKNKLDGDAVEREPDNENINLGADILDIGMEPPCVGQFTPIRMIEDADIISRFEHIPCGPGDMVLWDYRTPHSNSYRNASDSAREAVYIGLLPNIPLNREYIRNQLVRFKEGAVPLDQWHSHNEPQLCDYPFSPLGRKMVGLESWSQDLPPDAQQ